MPVSERSSDARPEWTAAELMVLTRAMAGIFLDQDAPLRMGILRKLTKAERAICEAADCPGPWTHAR